MSAPNQTSCISVRATFGDNLFFKCSWRLGRDFWQSASEAETERAPFAKPSGQLLAITFPLKRCLAIHYHVTSLPFKHVASAKVSYLVGQSEKVFGGKLDVLGLWPYATSSSLSRRFSIKLCGQWNAITGGRSKGSVLQHLELTGWF